MARVDIWEWSLDAPHGTEALLSPDERARAARFVNPVHAARFAAGRGRLRAALGRVTGRDPASLRFETNPQGKPSLPDGPEFNLSHSGARAMLAVSDGPEVGVDIEEWRPVEPAVARRYFTAAERAELAAMEFREGFFRCWTRKEAVIKAVGLGLSMPLGSFDVTLGAAPRLARIEGGAASEWHLADLSPGPGCAAALAIRDPSGPPDVIRHAL